MHEPASVPFRGWPKWRAVAANLVIASLGVVLALDAGEDWPVFGLPAGLLGSWSLVRVALTVAGRRRNGALWLTAGESSTTAGPVASGSPAARSAATRGVPETPYLLLTVDGVMRWQRCPRPWRPRRASRGANEMLVDCSMTGHQPDVLAAWLAGRFSLGTQRTGRRKGR